MDDLVGAYFNVYGCEVVQENFEHLGEKRYVIKENNNEELLINDDYRSMTGKKLGRVMKKAADLSNRSQFFNNPETVEMAQRSGATRQDIKNTSDRYAKRSDDIIDKISKHDPNLVKNKERLNRSTVNVRSTHVTSPSLRVSNIKENLEDIISEYLVSEGFCESYEAANVIMANMSDEWRESILEVKITPLTGKRLERFNKQIQKWEEKPHLRRQHYGRLTKALGNLAGSLENLERSPGQSTETQRKPRTKMSDVQVRE